MTALIHRFSQTACDQRRLRGRLAVRPRAHAPDVVSSQPLSQAGLTVRSEGNPETAGFHAANGLYGFLTLEPGSHIVRVMDPAGRYLPLRARVELDGAVPPTLDLDLLPAIGARFAAYDTVLWGQLRLDDGSPAALARVQIETGEGSLVTHADFDGHYVAWLRGLPARAAEVFSSDGDGNPLDGAFSLPPAAAPSPALAGVIITAHRYLRAIPSADPIAAVPFDFPGLDPDDPERFDSLYELLGAPVTLNIPVGRRTRYPPPP